MIAAFPRAMNVEDIKRTARTATTIDLNLIFIDLFCTIYLLKNLGLICIAL
jgi:hypothetical protein